MLRSRRISELEVVSEVPQSHLPLRLGFLLHRAWEEASAHPCLSAVRWGAAASLGSRFLQMLQEKSLPRL